MLAVALVGVVACGAGDSGSTSELVLGDGELDQKTLKADTEGVLTESSNTSAVSTHSSASGSIETSTRNEVRLGEVLWTTSQTKDRDGSFVLFRNRTHRDRAVHVLFGDNSPLSVGPRETVTWDCRKADGSTSLTVKTPSGGIVFANEVDCGDAVYVRSAVSPQ